MTEQPNTFPFQFGVQWVDKEIWLSQAGQAPWFYSLAKAPSLLSLAFEGSCSPSKRGHTKDAPQRKVPAISLYLQNRIPSAHIQSIIVIHLLNHSKILPQHHRFSISSGLIICRQDTFLTMQKNHDIKDISLTHFH